MWTSDGEDSSGGGEATDDDTSSDPSDDERAANNAASEADTTDGSPKSIQVADSSPQLTQEEPVSEEGSILSKSGQRLEIPPPVPQYPSDPSKPPGPGYQWRGTNPQPGAPEGGWYNEQTRETLRPDLDHPAPEGPHWDYRAPDGTWYRWFPDGRMLPKFPVT
jgi:hypothetical protein